MQNNYLKNYILPFFTLFFLLFSSVGMSASSESEISVSSHCCEPSGISYCDLSSGHYVCNDGGYSTCICTPHAAVTAYSRLLIGCCVWHGGVIDSSLGQVICADGSLSEVCSLQPAHSVAGIPTL